MRIRLQLHCLAYPINLSITRFRYYKFFQEQKNVDQGVDVRIGILTFYRNNYGAVLQAYALQTIVESLGHSVEIIDYRDAGHRSDSMFNSWRQPKNAILNLFMIFRYRLFCRRKKRLGDFYKNELHVSQTKYTTSIQLEEDVSSYDMFICGSDQVWRPRLDLDGNRAYFLGFVKQEQAIKASYAPSFGVSSVPESSHQAIKNWLTDIPNLSVREKTGGNIIQQISGRVANIVLDPTLLIDKKGWDSLAAPAQFKTPYILVYSTSQRGLFSKIVKHIKKKTKLPVVVLSLYSLNLISCADEVIYDAGPNEFLGLFSNAACVCTNSFHGVAFSIIYRKSFWSVPHNATNSRMADLLSRIELSDRQLSSQKHFPETPLDIDYSNVSLLLKEHRRNSIDFIKLSTKSC